MPSLQMMKVDCVDNSSNNSEENDLRHIKNANADAANRGSGSEFIEVLNPNENTPKMDLGKIRAALPPDVFVKSIPRGLAWMAWDLGICFGLHCAVYQCYQAGYYFVMAPLQLLCGFFMWATFVNGHDCGHGSFSDSEVLNLVCGFIMHGSLLVPFTSWARSHHFHHLHHNHVEKDYSHMWFHDPKYDTKNFKQMLKLDFFRSIILPVVAYWIYLWVPVNFGGLDGNHFFPGVFSQDRMWKGADKKAIVLGWVSALVVGIYMYAFISYMYEGSLIATALCYFPSWFTFCWWLHCVTYLQHHTEKNTVYDDTTFTFGFAAFETVDRQYGEIIDFLHHRITDCHVVHHLFFTKIPHYNLRRATDSLVAYLKANNLSHLYKSEKTPDFVLRQAKYCYESYGRAKLVTKDQKWLLVEAEEK